MSQKSARKITLSRSKSTPRRPSKVRQCKNIVSTPNNSKGSAGRKKKSVLAERIKNKSQVIFYDLQAEPNYIEKPQGSYYQTRSSSRKNEAMGDEKKLPHQQKKCGPRPSDFPKYNHQTKGSSQEGIVKNPIKEFWQNRSTSKSKQEISYIEEKDIYTLASGTLLNDSVVNRDLELLRREIIDENIKIMNTYFLLKIKDYHQNKEIDKIKRFLCKHDINENTILLVPVHWVSRRHWSFLKLEKGLVTVYDSLENKGILSNALKSLHLTVYKCDCAVKVEKNFPKQEGNSVDCGIFMLYGIRAIALGLTFQKVFAESIEDARLRIAEEICKNTLSKI